MWLWTKEVGSGRWVQVLALFALFAEPRVISELCTAIAAWTHEPSGLAWQVAIAWPHGT